MTKEYKELVSKILAEGQEQDCRNGSQLIIPHHAFTLDFGNTENATLSLRKMSYGGIVGEFVTLIDKEPLINTSQFRANGCNYWDSWGDEEGGINIDYANQMHPQLADLVENIKKDPNSRRHMLDLWVPENVEAGVLSLPCCWHNITFSVIDKTLHLKWTQRSVDTMIGLPADVYLAYLFMLNIATECGLAMGTCLFSLSNVHIYTEHIENANLLLKRTEADWSKPLKFELKV